MFIFSINDKDKIFNFEGKIHKTPCRIIIEGNKRIGILSEILKKNKITNIKVTNNVGNKKSGKPIKKMSTGTGGSISLATFIS